ncbi:hypothetical protein SNEBB_007229 [Seison nebaliae]|nr:hypothetical protein SNEBB_007229 [Seison nebaliae]
MDRKRMMIKRQRHLPPLPPAIHRLSDDGIGRSNNVLKRMLTPKLMTPMSSNVDSLHNFSTTKPITTSTTDYPLITSHYLFNMNESENLNNNNNNCNKMSSMNIFGNRRRNLKNEPATRFRTLSPAMLIKPPTDQSRHRHVQQQHQQQPLNDNENNDIGEKYKEHHTNQPMTSFLNRSLLIGENKIFDNSFNGNRSLTSVQLVNHRDQNIKHHQIFTPHHSSNVTKERKHRSISRQRNSTNPPTKNTTVIYNNDNSSETPNNVKNKSSLFPLTYRQRHFLPAHQIFHTSSSYLQASTTTPTITTPINNPNNINNINPHSNKDGRILMNDNDIFILSSDNILPNSSLPPLAPTLTKSTLSTHRPTFFPSVIPPLHANNLPTPSLPNNPNTININNNQNMNPYPLAINNQFNTLRSPLFQNIDGQNVVYRNPNNRLSTVIDHRYSMINPFQLQQPQQLPPQIVPIQQQPQPLMQTTRRNTPTAFPLQQPPIVQPNYSGYRERSTNRATSHHRSVSRPVMRPPSIHQRNILKSFYAPATSNLGGNLDDFSKLQFLGRGIMSNSSLQYYDTNNFQYSTMYQNAFQPSYQNNNFRYPQFEVEQTSYQPLKTANRFSSQNSHQLNFNSSKHVKKSSKPLNGTQPIKANNLSNLTKSRTSIDANNYGNDKQPLGDIPNKFDSQPNNTFFHRAEQNFSDTMSIVSNSQQQPVKRRQRKQQHSIHHRNHQNRNNHLSQKEKSIYSMNNKSKLMEYDDDQFESIDNEKRKSRRLKKLTEKRSKISLRLPEYFKVKDTEFLYDNYSFAYRDALYGGRFTDAVLKDHMKLDEEDKKKLFIHFSQDDMIHPKSETIMESQSIPIPPLGQSIFIPASQQLPPAPSSTNNGAQLLSSNRLSKKGSMHRPINRSPSTNLYRHSRRASNVDRQSMDNRLINTSQSVILNGQISPAIVDERKSLYPLYSRPTSHCRSSFKENGMDNQTNRYSVLYDTATDLTLTKNNDENSKTMDKQTINQFEENKKMSGKKFNLPEVVRRRKSKKKKLKRRKHSGTAESILSTATFDGLISNLTAATANTDLTSTLSRPPGPATFEDLMKMYDQLKIIEKQMEQAFKLREQINSKIKEEREKLKKKYIQRHQKLQGGSIRSQLSEKKFNSLIENIDFRKLEEKSKIVQHYRSLPIMNDDTIELMQKQYTQYLQIYNQLFININMQQQEQQKQQQILMQQPEMANSVIQSSIYGYKPKLQLENNNSEKNPLVNQQPLLGIGGALGQMSRERPNSKSSDDS